MQTFQLVTTSRLHYVFILLAGIFASFFAVIVLFPKGTGLIVIVGIFIGLSFINYWFAEKHSKQVVELSIHTTHLYIDWIKLPIFSNKQNRQISWAEINNYVYQVEQEFDLFKLTLNNGERLKFSISHDPDHQESFYTFYKSFLNHVNALQAKEGSGQLSSIKQGKPFYETPIGITMAFLLAVLVIFGIVFSFINHDKRPVSWGKLIAGIFASLFYIRLVWSHNKKKKKCE